MVEKAPENHDEDPQKPKTTGDTVSISDLKPSKPPEDSSDKPKPTEAPEDKEIRHGIDVSKWQGEIDWKKVKESGIEFAMIRVGYRTLQGGVVYEDPWAEYNLHNAIANGIPVGVYFFSTAINKEEALQEAQWVTDYIAPYNITYPVVYDCEGYNNKNNRHSHLNKEERTDLAIYFLDHVEANGYTPMFYNSLAHIQNNASWNTTRLNSKGYKIWVAQYPGNYTPGSRTRYTGIYHMWQYTSKGRVPGIKGNVDLNEAYFGENAPAEQIPSPTDPKHWVDFIRYEEVDEVVTAKSRTNVRNLPTTIGSEIVGVLDKNAGDTARRIGIGDDGWSKIIYNGQVAYASNNYLEFVSEWEPEEDIEDPEEPEGEEPEIPGDPGDECLGEECEGCSDEDCPGNVEDECQGEECEGCQDEECPGKIEDPEDEDDDEKQFEEVNEEVTVINEAVLLNLPSVEKGEVIETLTEDDIAKRVGIRSDGWSKLEYDLEDETITAYAKTELLRKVLDE